MMTLRICLGLLLAAIVTVGAISQRRQEPTASKPDATRFEMETLVPEGELDEPLAFAVARDGRAYIAERRGSLKVFLPQTGTTRLAHRFDVYQENEQGLIGVTLDPRFEANRWIYVLYADASDSAFFLKRFTVSESEELDLASSRTLLRIPVDRDNTNHTGGGMTWDASGNLYITVGNNTANQPYMQTDERPGRETFDDQRTAANSNDLRGKILRIHPEPDGTYTVPAGNLFPVGMPNTRPEIYSMGHRNPWRISVDSVTGYIYWGEIGPDQVTDSPSTSRGYDEFNRATEPGFFGWPYFIGKNHLGRFADYVANRFTEAKDPLRPINASRNNTGIRELPPAREPLVEYPFAESEEFPQLGSGGRCAIGGPVYRRADFASTAARPWPAYFEGRWIVTDCVRSWVQAMQLSADGNVLALEEVFPNPGIAEPMDIKFGPDGDLYILDYGSIWYTKSPDSKLVRIKYQAGNRAPVAAASADRIGGVPPFAVRLDGSMSKDYDGDPLRYVWTVTAEGKPARTFEGPSVDVTFTERGVYTATLTVTDGGGATGVDSAEIVSGNAAPVVRLNVTGNVPGNGGVFVPGVPLRYAVEVEDPEDGSLSSGIDPEKVAISIDYLPEKFDVARLLSRPEPVDAQTRFGVGRTLIDSSDCRACHHPSIRTRGPAMAEIAARYATDPLALDRLAAKVRDGGTGVWGDEVMPAHPTFTMHETRLMVQYMLASRNTTISELPLSGSYTPAIPADDAGRGALLVRAVYTDRAADGTPALTSQDAVVLRSSTLSALQAERTNVEVSTGRGASGVRTFRDGVLVFRDVDLTGVTQVGIAARASGGRAGQAGGRIEVRIGSATGTLLGTVEVPARGAGPGAADVRIGVNLTEDIGGPIPTAAPAAAPAGGAGAPGAGAGRAGGAGGGRAGGAAGVLVRLNVPVSPQQGRHDVYLVFKNDDASPTVPLMTVDDIRLSFGS